MATVPTTHTVVDGLATSSEMNSYFRDPIAFLMKPPIFRLRQTVVQSLTSGVWTAVTFTTEDVDTDVDGVGGHDNAVNTSRYTARYAGWYEVSFMANIAASAAGQRGGRVAVNGTAITGSESFIDATAAGGIELPASTALVFLNVGDYVEAQALQSSGGAINTAVGSCLNGVWRSLA